MPSLAIPFRNGAALAAELDLPSGSPRALIVLAHGSSPSGKNHPLLAGLAAALAAAANGIACLRFDFPFVSQNKTSPNSEAVLDGAYSAALAHAGARFPGIPLIAAGKSLGARAAARVVCSLARSAKSNPGAARVPDAVLFLTYPLHPAGRMDCDPNTPAAQCPQPMLFIQGTRDPFANRALLRDFIASLAPRGQLCLIEGGDHALRCAREQESVIQECAAEIARWLISLKPGRICG